MKNKIKGWFLRVFFPDVAKQMKDMCQQIGTLNIVVADLLERSGGKDDKVITEKVVIQLGDRLDVVENIAARHQNILDLIVEEIDPIEYTNIFGDNDVN